MRALPRWWSRVAEHDADLHANLVDKNHQAVGLLDGAGELAHGLAEQARLQADVNRPSRLDFARGVSAATESITSTSTAPERSISATSSACSPVSGWDMMRSSTLTPSFSA